ncbi:hypothetical protein, partial [Parabacteroides goldsteinii]|uniref:hypothetical protein n=1 Tax=Parabacteroides goldsteinii TaxID=328812 RepID=UPI0022E7D226
SEWLKVKGAPVTKTLSENTQLTFFLDNAKLGGAKKATVTLKNKIKRKQLAHPKHDDGHRHQIVSGGRIAS